MNKRNVDLNRFNKAFASVRPTEPFISDRNLVYRVKEYYDILTEIENAEAAKVVTAKPYDYLYAKDVAALLNVGISKAYELIAETNAKLKAKGKYIIPGRVPRKLFMEQLY